MEHVDELLSKLHDAQKLARHIRDKGNHSRELSIIITKIDEAILWRKEQCR